MKIATRALRAAMPGLELTSSSCRTSRPVLRRIPDRSFETVERLRRKHAVDHHGSRPQRDDVLAARRILIAHAPPGSAARRGRRMPASTASRSIGIRVTNKGPMSFALQRVGIFMPTRCAPYRPPCLQDHVLRCVHYFRLCMEASNATGGPRSDFCESGFYSCCSNRDLRNGKQYEGQCLPVGTKNLSSGVVVMKSA